VRCITPARLKTHPRELIDPKIAEHKGRIPGFDPGPRPPAMDSGGQRKDRWQGVICYAAQSRMLSVIVSAASYNYRCADGLP
jgi:hypothetical protein